MTNSDRVNEPIQALIDALNASISTTLADVHTSFPAVVQSFDEEKQEADVVPVIKRRKNVGGFEELPLLPSIPVLYPSSNESSIYFPLAKGDSVYVMISERSIDAWLASGNRQSNPSIARKFDLSDAVCIPARQHSKEYLDNKKYGSGLIINHKGLELRVSSDGKIYLGTEGEEADEPLVLGTALKDKLDRILDILIAGAHVLTTSPGNPVAPNPSTSAKFATIKAELALILSDKIFGEK